MLKFRAAWRGLRIASWRGDTRSRRLTDEGWRPHEVHPLENVRVIRVIRGIGVIRVIRAIRGFLGHLIGRLGMPVVV